MPPLGFLNRNTNKTNADTTPTTGSSSSSSQGTSANEYPPVDLPDANARRLVRDCVLQAAQTVYLRYGVNATVDLEDDADLSKSLKVQKREEQFAAQEGYRNRLEAVLGPTVLSPILSTCLLLLEDTTTSSSSSLTKLCWHDAFACTCLLLCNYVLLTASTNDNDAASVVGYDARVRNVLRMACISLWTETLERHDTSGVLLAKLQEFQQSRSQIQVVEENEEDMELQLANMLEAEYSSNKTLEDNDTTATCTTADNDNDNNAAVYSNLYRQYATRKFQALEQAISTMILKEMVQKATPAQSLNRGESTSGSQKDGQGNTTSGRFSRKNLVRAAKIGGVGVAAGALFAVTGGLAAPGIAAGLAALGVGGTALTLAASPVALITLFGVGGGGLSAYKMKRRTDGLTEFEIRHHETPIRNGDGSNSSSKAHLHTTVCISGWLNDEHDFQRPWGVTPVNLSRLERLKRFFAVMDPPKVKYAEEILKPYSGNTKDGSTSKEEDELWQAFSMTLKEQYGKTPDDLLPLEERAVRLSKAEDDTLRGVFSTILRPTPKGTTGDKTIAPASSNLSVATDDILGSIGNSQSNLQVSSQEQSINIRVWDYQTEYGGDIFTIQWESAVLRNMCRVADSLVKELRNKATKEVLKRTVMATVMAAVALPAILMGLAGGLDNDWTLITIRSDLAGVELARSLLQSNERRPVNLVGYSFGARVVYACLRELARHQAIWEAQQQERKSGDFKKKWKKKGEEDAIEYTREPASIVQDAIMMGAPLFVSRSKLRIASHMVAGRFVNCYSRKDWILSLMFQYKNTSGIMRGTCGTGPVKGVGGIENYDVSSLVSWHANYCRMVPDILDLVGFDQPMPTQ